MILTPYAPLLVSLRQERGWSQASTASALGMSRASYIALEKGTKELSLREAVTVTEVFSITLDSLLSAQVPEETKYEDMVRAFLRAAAATQQVIKKTKLAHLLYLADFSWYYRHHTSMSHMNYRKHAYGIAPDALFRLLDTLEGNGTIVITQILRDDYHMYELSETRAAAATPLLHLSPAEQEHITAIWAAWAAATTAEITAFTTNQSPYRLTAVGDIVSYDHILADDAHTVV